jgi:hypothetical protein
MREGRRVLREGNSLLLKVGVILMAPALALAIATVVVSVTLERVMNLGGNRIEMRIPRSDWFPRDLRFPHS